MKPKTYDSHLAILAARVALSDQESVSDPDLLWAAGEAMFYAAAEGTEHEILRGMLKAAERCGNEGAVAALKRTLGEFPSGRVYIDPNDARALVRLLKDCDGAVRGKDAETLGRAAYESADADLAIVLRAMLDEARRDFNDENARVLKAALDAFDRKDRRADEIELLTKLRDVANCEGVEGVVRVLNQAIARLTEEGSGR